MSTPLFVDTTVLVYAVGQLHPQREPCRAILRAATAGRIELHVSVEAIQEFVHHRLRRVSPSEAVRSARAQSTQRRHWLVGSTRS